MRARFALFLMQIFVEKNDHRYIEPFMFKIKKEETHTNM